MSDRPPPARHGPRPSLVRRLGSGSLWGRIGQYLAGLLGLGLGLAILLEAGIGVGPWGVFHDGIARITPLTFGQALMSVGVVVLALAWFWLGERPGPGSFVNMLLVGPSVDLFRASGWIPVQHDLLPGMVQAVIGVALLGLASGAYITARFGAGPRDSFLLGLSRRFAVSIRRMRTIIELIVLAIGILLGGSFGLGTLLFAFAIGPSMQTSLRVFRGLRPLPRPLPGD